MGKMAAFFALLIIALVQTATLGCFLYEIDYKGTNLNAEHSMRTEDAATRQKLCQNEPRCYFWTRLSGFRAFGFFHVYSQFSQTFHHLMTQKSVRNFKLF